MDTAWSLAVSRPSVVRGVLQATHSLSRRSLPRVADERAPACAVQLLLCTVVDTSGLVRVSASPSTIMYAVQNNPSTDSSGDNKKEKIDSEHPPALIESPIACAIEQSMRPISSTCFFFRPESSRTCSIQPKSFIRRSFINSSFRARVSPSVRNKFVFDTSS